MNNNINIYDGDYKIIFSETLNIYERHIKLQKFQDFEINFIFEQDTSIDSSNIRINGDNVTKIINITLINFNNSLGVGTTTKIPILKDDENKQVFFSAYVSTLGEKAALQHITINFYTEI